MLSVNKAEYVGDFVLRIEFSDAQVGIVDLKDLIFNGKLKPFRSLQDQGLFQRFYIDYTIHWSDELDLAPEYLYYKAFENRQELHGLFRQWGYLA